ncbi:MAG: hypothetical protein DWQ31_20740 [Planctomycetota bacterium]|nr:MAG: hypothetical protein DWQ31_20740 [Planctomycetota bacterium]
MPDHLLALFLVLVVITVVGHGIWVLLAVIFRSLFPASASRHTKSVAAASMERPFAQELDIVRRHLALMIGENLIDLPMYRRLQEALQQYARRHTQQGSQTPPAEDTVIPVVATPLQTPPQEPILAAAVDPVEVTPKSAPTTSKPTGVTPINATTESKIEDKDLELVPESAPVLAKSAPISRAMPVTPAAEAVVPHPLDVRVEPQHTVVTSPPTSAHVAGSQGLTALLASFMEDRNIRWGEVLSGLLIVGSAIGLVVSLWAHLREAIPYFPALIFMLATLAIHGAGLYTLRKWKLRSTSQGLLVIGLLLIPLNFLAGIALSPEGTPVTEPIYLIAVVVGLSVFSWVAYSAGRAVLNRATWFLPLAVMGVTATQLIVDRASDATSPAGWVVALAMLPVVVFLAALVGQLRLADGWRQITARRGGELLLLLGVGLFSLVMPLTLLVHQAADWQDRLTLTAPAIQLTCVGLLATGLLLHRRTWTSDLAGYRLTGTAIVVLASLGMLAALYLAWPRPWLLIALGLLGAATFLAFAVVARMRYLHAGCGVSLAGSILLAYHVLTDQVAANAHNSLQLFQAIMRGDSAVVCLLIAGALGLVVWQLARGGRRAAALAYGASASVVSLVSLAAAGYSGFLTDGSDAAWATLVFAVYAAAAIAGGGLLRRREATVLGAILMLIAWGHGLVFNPYVVNGTLGEWLVFSRPVTVALLAHAMLATTIAVAGRRFAASREALVEPLLSLATLTSAAVVASALVVSEAAFAKHAGYLAGVAAVWLIGAVVRRSGAWFCAAQGCATVCLAFLVTAFCQSQSWWEGIYFDPRHVLCQIGVLALWCGAFATARRALPATSQIGTIMDTPWPAVDRVLIHVLVVALATFVLLGCMPGVTAEFYGDGPAAAPVQLLGKLSGEQLLVLALLVVGTLAALSAWAMGSARVLGLKPVAIALASFLVLVLSHLGPLSDAAWQWAGVSDPTLATGAASWLVLGLVTLALVATLRERLTKTGVVGVVYLSSAVPLLIAAQFAGQIATASALRWTMALVAAVCVVAFSYRGRIAAWSARCGIGDHVADESSQTVEAARIVVLVQLALPVLALTLGILVAAGVNDGSLGGPAIDSLFHRLGTTISYAVPMFLLAMACTLSGIRERNAWFGLAAAILVHLGVSSGQLVTALTATTSSSLLIAMLPANMIATAGCLLVWIAIRRRIAAADDGMTTNLAEQASAGTQGALTVLAVVLAAEASTMIAWIGGSLLWQPAQLANTVAQWHNPWSYTALTVAAIGASVYAWHFNRHALMHVLVIGGAAVAALAAVAVGLPAGVVNWQPYHTLLAGLGLLTTTCTGLTCLAGSDLAQRLPRSWNIEELSITARRWAWVLIGLIALYALRGGIDDPTAPWWTAGSVFWAVGLTFLLAWRRSSRPLSYASTALAALGASLIWYLPWDRTGDAMALVHLVEANLVAAALAAIGTLVLELWHARRNAGNVEAAASRIPAVYHVVAVVGLLAVCLVAFPACGLWAMSEGWLNAPLDDLGGALTLAALAALLVATLWIPKARYNIGGLYLVGLAAALLTLKSVVDRLQPQPWFEDDYFVPLVTATLSLYVLLTSTVWQWRSGLFALGYRIGIAELPQLVRRAWRWLSVANVLLVVLVAVLTLVIVLDADHTRNMRLLAAFSVALLVPAVAMLSYEGLGQRMRLFALILAALAVVEAGWAQLVIRHADVFWLEQAIRATVSLAVVAFAYGMIGTRVVRRESDWFPALRRASVFVALLTVPALAWSLGAEAWHVAEAYRTTGNTDALPFTTAEIVQVTVVLLGLAATLISIALSAGDDPLGLSERMRIVYVYAAEFVLFLIFVHIGLTRPEWFQGVLRPYWPLIVMAIAFGGRALGACARRAGLPVLSRPLETTGAMLPLVPAIGYTMFSDHVAIQYSSTLMTVGLFYLVLSMVARKPIYMAAAVLAGNGTLWALFHETSWEFLGHPQMWLIPPAVSLLVASQLNRHRLRKEQLTAIRYAAAALIYVSSTSEMLIHGIETLWPIMIMGGLAVLGALVGIAFRIRAYLYLGVSFLLVSIVSLVWHTATIAEANWPWWGFGFALGIALLVMFGIFEKKRNDVERVIHGLRQWDA